MLKHKILIVDDDTRLLSSFKRILSARFDVTTAENGDSALELIKEDAPFSIIISDYKMPGMNGVEFLSEVNKRVPDTVRILLTGYAEINVALEAVNEGNIFRMLQKPCPPKTMAKALVDGIQYYEIAAARRELMEKTIQKSVGVLGDLISLVKPTVYGRISRITPYVRHICREMDPPYLWEAVTGTRLSMIGFVTLPESIVEKDLAGQTLGPREQRLFNEHPSLAASFIEKIPRLEEVARIIAYQEKCYNGTGVPEDNVQKDDIPLGARILKVCLDCDRLTSWGLTQGEALNALAGKDNLYDPDVLGHLFSTLGESPAFNERKIYLHGLEPGMVVAEDIFAMKGEEVIKLLAEGQEVSEMAIAYLLRFSQEYNVNQPFKVLETTYCKL
ncbi:MAG: response regulator [Desulfovibrio sp.]|nr:MAG: response regulator [Desulfovibrio sp.]